jgi:DNA-binding transcriptional MerR regulator
MATQQPVRRRSKSSSDPASIPDKLYFRIGDVARLCGLPAYVLRFWETEFPQLKPNKGGTGQRLYRKRDVEVVVEIKRLLYDEGFTIPGARRLLAEKRRTAADAPAETPPVVETRTRVEAPSKQKASNASASKSSPTTKVVSKAAPVSPGIEVLRKEMRELLALLAAHPTESAPAPPRRQETKKSVRVNEPTLF